MPPPLDIAADFEPRFALAPSDHLLQGSTQAVAAYSSPQSFAGAGSPRHQQHPASTVASATRRLGLLGIPLSSSEGGDDDDDENDDDLVIGGGPSAVMSTDSLEGNPPGSPAVAVIEPPAATYSRGGSTRSGQSTKSGEDREVGAFVTEESFRDIVRPLSVSGRVFLPRGSQSLTPHPSRSTSSLFKVRRSGALPLPESNTRADHLSARNRSTIKAAT